MNSAAIRKSSYADVTLNWYNDQQSDWSELNPNRKYPDLDNRIKETYIAESAAQRTHQYDMYKRFIRWASDRLDDDGIIAFITNRAYINTRQDDGFRKIASNEFTDMYILDLGSDVRLNPKISGTTHNVFGIQTGVAIGFFVREKSKLGKCGIHYARREDNELAVDKLAYLNKAMLDDIAFEEITPDKRNDWLNQSNSDFDKLISLADRKTKLAKRVDDEQAVFRLYSAGINTSRDQWVYDFDLNALSDKVKFFCGIYNKELHRFNVEQPAPNSTMNWVDRSIKWTSELENHLIRGSQMNFDRGNMIVALYRPFVHKFTYFAPLVTHRRYQIPQVFPQQGSSTNKVICFPGNAGKSFSVIATDRVYSYDLLKTTQCLPLYRYTEDGERVSNITDWGLKVVNDHYRKEFGRHFEEAVGGESITAEDIFAYTYAVLHDPVYRYDYRVDLLREFPRLPLYHDFRDWRDMGRELLDLHINFESAEPYPLERRDTDKPATRVMLRANADDKKRGVIRIDDQTTLSGVPESAWRYMLGNRSALEWALDQYKEKKPRDPTIRERFNTYRFADHKEQVIGLLKRVCTVSHRTAEIVGGMAYWMDGKLVVSGDRDKHE